MGRRTAPSEPSILSSRSSVPCFNPHLADEPNAKGDLFARLMRDLFFSIGYDNPRMNHVWLRFRHRGYAFAAALSRERVLDRLAHSQRRLKPLRIRRSLRSRPQAFELPSGMSSSSRSAARVPEHRHQGDAHAAIFLPLTNCLHADGFGHERQTVFGRIDLTRRDEDPLQFLG